MKISKSLLTVSVATTILASIYASGITSALAADATPAISADILNAEGKTIGHVDGKQTAKGVEFKVHVTGLTPGDHGIHIHSMGKCEGPDFKTAGAHFASATQHHGMTNPTGTRHWGDLPNLVVGKDGTADTTFSDNSVTLKAGDNSLTKAGGTSLVIHAGKDDEKSDPAGNSGSKVACAVLTQ